MDIADAFDPHHDAAGKRERALSLYGIDERFRASDDFVAALDRILICAVHFARAVGATIALWPGPDPVVLAHTGVEVSRAELACLWDAQDRPSEPCPDVVRGDDTATSLSGAAVCGYDRLRLGLLVVKQPGLAQPDQHARCLLETLARACTAALDERRYIVSRRRLPSPVSLRLLAGPDRRQSAR